MIIFVDIDETICYYDDNKLNNCSNVRDYSKAKPYLKRIEKINDLYSQENTIVYWTARGTKTGINWFLLTQEQLNKWECKYHELRMGKPNYDLFIDDKNINSDYYFNSDCNQGCINKKYHYLFKNSYSFSRAIPLTLSTASNVFEPLCDPKIFCL